jgi:type I site-specific restriction endonuclease
LPFEYESTGTETHFADLRDPDWRSRRVFAFHRPETLKAWISNEDTLRDKLRLLPDLHRGGLWQCQFEAITNLEKSLADNRPRALIQMATGSGKTYAAVNFVYRLIKFANARRVLFLVSSCFRNTVEIAWAILVECFPYNTSFRAKYRFNCYLFHIATRLFLVLFLPGYI